MPDRGFLIERLIRQTYVDLFNITNLDDDEKPFALVEISNVDGARELGPISCRIREFQLHGIGPMFNISLTEFLELPHMLAETLIDHSVNEKLAINKMRDQDAKSEERKARQDVDDDLDF